MSIRPRAALAARWPSSRPQLQLHLHRRPPLTRNFHPSRPNHFFSETTVQYAHHAFQYVHDFSGLPWALAIPITAILVRTLFSLLTYPALILNQRKMQMSEPLQEAYRNAWNNRAKILAEQAGEDPPLPIQTINLGGNRKVTMLFSRHFKYNRYVSMLPVLYWPVWLESVQALARMSRRGEVSADVASDNSIAPTSSLASEGLLWFPDLTAFDPILCLAFSSLCVVNALSGGFQGFRLPETFSVARVGPRRRARLYNMMGVTSSAALGLCFSALQVPAAVTLFCVSSSLCALVTRNTMRRVIGESKNSIMPARAKAVGIRRILSDANGITRYAGSVSVPKEWDNFFLERHLWARTGAAARPRPTSSSAKFPSRFTHETNTISRSKSRP